jgi:hypothetical protein
MYIITVQWPMADGFSGYTGYGTVQITPGTTRVAVYNQLYEQTQEETRRYNLNVMFFSLEPNAI